MVAPVTQTGASAVFRLDSTGSPTVFFSWNFDGNYSATYRVYRNNTQIAVVPAPTYSVGTPSPQRMGYTDHSVVAGATYSYQVAEVSAAATGSRTAGVSVTVPTSPPPAPGHVQVAANFDTNAATPTPYVDITWDNDYRNTNYTVFRDGTVIATVNAISDPSVPRNGYRDTGVTIGGIYQYSVQAHRGALTGPGSALVTAYTPLYPTGYDPAPVVPPVDGGVNRWTFTDVYQKGIAPYTYVFQINPNDGGSPTFEKQVTPLKVTGPNMMPLLQEGAPGEAQMGFSGIILTQTQLETMEIWYRKRILLLVQDDLGRRFYGILQQWNPKRSRRSSNFWYHTYDASMALTAYYNASGQRIYGRFL